MVQEIRFRRGTQADSRRAFDLSVAAVSDLMIRQNHARPIDAASLWKVLESYLAHLATHAAEWWLAEDASDGTLVGHARSIERGGLFELSELFVRPGAQSSGLGKELIERAFPKGRGEVRVIIATNDARAIARYYAADTVARFPIASLSGTPKPTLVAHAELRALAATADDVGTLADLEREVTGYARHADYPWLLRERQGLLYRRGERVVGFAFFGKAGLGPIAALEPADQRFILADLEGRAHAAGLEDVSFSVPMVNEIAMNHLLNRGFEIDGPVNFFMSNRAFGNFDRFITFGPPIVL